MLFKISAKKEHYVRRNIPFPVVKIKTDQLLLQQLCPDLLALDENEFNSDGPSSEGDDKFLETWKWSTYLKSPINGDTMWVTPVFFDFASDCRSWFVELEYRVYKNNNTDNQQRAVPTRESVHVPPTDPYVFGVFENSINMTLTIYNNSGNLIKSNCSGKTPLSQLGSFKKGKELVQSMPAKSSQVLDVTPTTFRSATHFTSSVSKKESAAVRQKQSPTTSPPTQEKRRYGSWMLVTKKSKPVEAAKNSRQSRKDPNSSVVNRGNQFSVLADVNDNVEPTVSRNKSDKGKSKSAPRQSPKDKSAIPSTSAPPIRNSPLPSQAAPPVHAQRTTISVRNRGGRSGAPRGRNRSSGRDNPVSRDFSSSVPTVPDWINQPPHQDVFRFASTVAGTHTPVANATGMISNLVETGSPSSPTPREGGDQTSPGSTSLP
nr:LINE-type retrotransposon LIb DNA [Ipomoea batatas]